MPTVIDELIVRLGLDAKDFTTGQKEAVSSFLKTKEAATKTGKEFEETAKKTAAGVEKMTRNIIALFAAIAGAKTLKELVTGLTQANAELGRFSANVGLSPQRVAAWGAAVQRVGGDAGQAQGTIAKLTSTFTAFKNGMGNLPDEFWFLRQRSGVNINPLGSTEESLSGIAEAIQKLSKTDRKSAFNFAQGLGIDPATFEVMRQQGAGITKYLQDLEKYGPSDKAIKSAQELQEAWGKLVQTLGQVAQKFMEVASPHLTALIESLTKLFERLANEVDWNAIGKGMEQFAAVAGDLTKNMDGATAAVTAFFALWTGAQFAKALANILLLRGLGSGAAAGAGSAFMAAFTGTAGVAALLYGGKKHILSDPEKAAQATPEANKQRIQDRHKAITDWFGSWFSSSSEVPLSAAQMASRAQMGDGRKGDIQVDGRPASKGNPLPVTIASGNNGGGGGFWDSVGNAIGSFFGGSAMAAGMGPKSALDTDDSGIPNGTASSKVTGSAKRLMDRLVTKHGWTPAAASIAAGNAHAESGFRSGIMGDPQVPGGSWGLFQWNRSRLAALKQFAKVRGKDWKDFDVQTDFFAEEAGRMIPEWKSQTDLSQADRIGKRFEGYAGPVQRNRSRQAAAYFGGYERPVLDQGPVAGAAGSAAMTSIANDNRRSSSSNVDTRIGSLNVITNATDSKSIADHLWDDLYRRIGQSSTAAAANSGPQ